MAHYLRYEIYLPVRYTEPQTGSVRSYFRSLLQFSLLIVLFPSSANAQRAMLTEGTAIVREGHVQFEIGTEGVKQLRNFKSDRERDQLRLGIVGFNIGTGGRTNIELGWPAVIFQRDPIFGTTHDVGDATFFTKTLLISETRHRPAVAVRFGTKLPNAGDEDGIGTDETDFFGSFPTTKQFGRLEIRLEPGIGILGNPQKHAAQNDVFTYRGGGIVRGKRVDLFGEVNGRLCWRACRKNNLLSVGRVGAQVHVGDYIWDVAGSVGLISQSEDWGITVGVMRAVRVWRAERTR